MIKTILQTTLAIVFFNSSIFAEEPYKIGVSLPLSGETAYLGVELKNTLEFIDNQIGRGRFQLIFEDDKCQAKEATAVAQKFINIDQVKGALVTCSMSILPTASIYQKSKVPVIVTLGSASEVSKLGEGIFRTSTNDYQAAQYLYHQSFKNHQRVLAFVDENDYSISFYKNFNSFLTPAQQSKAEYFKVDNLDLRSVILRNKTYNPDSFLLLPLSVDALLNIARQIRALGFNQKIYSAYMTFPKGSLKGIEGDGFYNLLNASAINVLTPEGQKLYQEFKSQYPPLSYDLIFVTAIESYRAMTEAILNSPEDVANYLASKKFQGIIGEWNFNDKREVEFWKFEVKEVSLEE